MRLRRQNRLVEHLSDMRVLSLCDRDELETIARMATPVFIEAGRHVTEEGQQAREFFLIASGDAGVYRDGVKIGELAEGDFFGEMAVLSGGVRGGTVIADTDMELDVVNRRDFVSMLESTPHLTLRILETLAARMQESDATGQRYLKRRPGAAAPQRRDASVMP